MFPDTLALYSCFTSLLCVCRVSLAARDADTSKNKPKGAASHENGIQAKPEAVGAGPEPVLPPLPSIEDVGDIEVLHLRL